MTQSVDRPDRNIPGYPDLLNDVRQLLEHGRNEAFQRIDHIRARTYVAIGKRILEREFQYKDRAEYGSKIVAALAADLQFSDSNLYNMISVARVFDPDSLPPRLSWSHLVRLANVPDDAARQFYLEQITQHQWSTRYLEQQIASNLY